MSPCGRLAWPHVKSRLTQTRRQMRLSTDGRSAAAAHPNRRFPFRRGHIPVLMGAAERRNAMPANIVK
jgi:hypothetical protein